MTAPCGLSHHSPRFNGKVWSCEDCVNGTRPSPLARLHAALTSSRAARKPPSAQDAGGSQDASHVQAQSTGRPRAMRADVLRRAGSPTDAEWSAFVAALKQAVGPGGFISQTRVRPLIQAIPHKRRGLCFRRAIKAGLIRPIGYEPSTDVAGKNAGRPQQTYEWIGEAA